MLAVTVQQAIMFWRRTFVNIVQHKKMLLVTHYSYCINKGFAYVAYCEMYSACSVGKRGRIVQMGISVCICC